MLKRQFKVFVIMIFAVYMSRFALAQVSWIEKYDDALRQGKSEGRLIVVDLFPDWCPHCREMAGKVYPNFEFIKFCRSQIFMHLNAETDPEGIRLNRKFSVDSYPTILVFNAEGQEIQRLLGGRDVKNLIHELKAIFDDPKPCNEYIQKARKNKDDCELQYRVGKRALDRKNYSLARLLLTRAAGNSNKDAAIRSLALLNLAKQVLDLAPESAEVHLLLAMINFGAGLDENEASKKRRSLSAGLSELRLARRLDPDDMNIYLAAKNILASRHLPQDPESPDTQKSYAEAETRFAQGLYGMAMEAYTKTIKLEPGFGKAYLRYGDCFLAGGKTEKALGFYQAAIAKSPLNASAYHLAADALRRLGKTDEARRYIILSLLADPEYPPIWSDLEQVVSSQGKLLRRHADLIPIQFLFLGLDANTYDESLYDDLPPQTIPAWREYVRNKLLWRQEKFAKMFPGESFYHASFDEELESLEAAVRKWDTLKLKNSTLRDEKLDFLHQLSIDEQMHAFIYLELFTEEYRTLILLEPAAGLEPATY